MTSPRKTRRQVIIAIVAVCSLVIGGLGWATRSAVRLERVEAQAAQRAAREASLTGARALAVSKLDALVGQILDREQGRPYEHFRPYYKPARAYNEEDGSEVRHILLESPLRKSRGPDWLLLHFQATETHEREEWSSPQLTHEDLQLATPAWAIPAVDRPRLAMPENWLAALKGRYLPLELLQKLEQAVRAEGEEPAAPTVEAHPINDAAGPRDAPPETPAGLSRRAAEFFRRAARLVQLQHEGKPIEPCWPETVAYENLGAPARQGGSDDGSVDCVEIWWPPMKPVWLDLTMDGQRQLAFLRTVVVERGDFGFCTLQGFLIDWTSLQQVLETEVRRLFPDARIVPVPTDEPVSANLAHTMMQTLPARLETGTPAFHLSTELSTGLRVGLAVAWVATALALVSIGYGTMKYVSLAERRMRFVAAVTHELRTPLTSFQIYSDLLADMPREDAKQRRSHAETLRKEAKRLARLVENVLAYSRIGDSEPDLQWQRVAPRALLEMTQTATKDQCAAANKKPVIDDRCDEALKIETDPEFIVQILTNLVENACKYSAEADDPRIWLVASVAPDGTLVIEVDDAGPGVPAQHRREVFEPFRRADTSNAEHPGGMGLGLALSAHWASCLGGRLFLRRSSRPGGRFTNFVLEVPIVRRT